MAKLSAHGEIIEEINVNRGSYVAKYRRMSDGVILTNIGYGWKIAYRDDKQSRMWAIIRSQASGS